MPPRQLECSPGNEYTRQRDLRIARNAAQLQLLIPLSVQRQLFKPRSCTHRSNVKATKLKHDGPVRRSLRQKPDLPENTYSELSPVERKQQRKACLAKLRANMTSQSAGQAEASPGHDTIAAQDMEHKVCVFCGFRQVDGSFVSAHYPADKVNDVVKWFVDEW
jgi:hypothetical protein